MIKPKMVLDRIKECCKPKVYSDRGTIYPKARVLAFYSVANENTKETIECVHSIAEGNLSAFCTPKGNPTAFLVRFIKDAAGADRFEVMEVIE